MIIIIMIEKYKNNYDSNIFAIMCALGGINRMDNVFFNKIIFVDE